MTDAFGDYMTTSFRNYLEAHGIDLEALADDCIEPGKDYRDCEADFYGELDVYIRNFWKNLSSYVVESDVKEAVRDGIQFEDLVDGDRFTDDWVARSPRGRAVSKASKPKSKAPAKKPASKPKAVSKTSKPKSSAKKPAVKSKVVRR